MFDFLGVGTPPDPTKVKVMARGFKCGEEGLDAGAADRWRSQIGSFSNRWLRFFAGRAMRRYGYTDS